MTPERKRRLEEEWPSLAARLRWLFSRQNVPPRLIDDLVQETSLRLIGVWDDVAPSAPSWPLTRTIATNLLRDDARKRFREIAVEEFDDAGRSDTERSCLAKLELHRVCEALPHLTSSQREALLGTLEEKPGPATPAEKMLRVRARRSLRRMLEHVIVTIKTKRVAELFGWFSGGTEGAFSFACAVCIALSVGAGVAAPAAVASPVHGAGGHAVPDLTTVRASGADAAGPLATEALDAAAENRASRSVAPVHPAKERQTADEGQGSGDSDLPPTPIPVPEQPDVPEPRALVPEQVRDVTEANPDRGKGPGTPEPPEPKAEILPDEPLEALADVKIG